MSASTKTALPSGLPAPLFARILDEGHGPGAWHGADMRAALADVTVDAAFRRPGTDCHNIAEEAMHHAFWVGEVQRRLTGEPAPPLPLPGEDWFELDDESQVSWAAIVSLVETAHQRLSQAVGDITSGVRRSPLSESDRFDLVLGITAHAAHHSGRIQLIKRLVR